MSDRLIQVNANANYFEQLQRCISPTQMATVSACRLPKRQDSPPLTGAAIGVCGGWCIGYCQSVLPMKNITAMPSSISVWIANKRLHGCRNRISDFTRLHL